MGPDIRPTSPTPANDQVGATVQPTNQVAPAGVAPSEQPVGVSAPQQATTVPSYQPTQPMYVASSAAAGKSGLKGKRKLVFASVAGLVVLLLGSSAAAYFGYLVPNQPENIWATALKRTADGYDALVQDEKKSQTKAMETSGTFKVSGGDFATDGTYNVKTDGKSAIMTADAGVLTSRVSAEMRMIDATNSEYPDLYVKASGLKDLAALSPDYADIAAQFDNTWYGMDHTFFDNLVAQSGVDTSASAQDLTTDELVQIAQAIGEVNREYMFTEDTTKSIFKVVTNVGKEKQDDRNVYHFIVGLDKGHTKDYVSALASKLDTTPAKKLLDGKTFAEALNLDEMKKSIDEYKDTDTADVYVDMSTKVFRTIRFTDKDNSKNTLELGLHMTDTNVLPFVVKLTTDEDGSKVSMDLSMTVNRKSETFDGTLAVSGDDSTGKMTANVTMSAKPISDSFTVEKPADAKSINEVLGQLMGLGMDSSYDDSSSYDDTSLDSMYQMYNCTTVEECMANMEASGTTGI